MASILEHPAKGADLSPCGQYRYRLWRTWDASLDTATWVMLNPSTADASKDDATIRRCIGFTKRWGLGGIEVVNLFAWRSTYPHELYKAADPVGAGNDLVIEQAAYRGRRVILAWGDHGKHRDRSYKVRQALTECGLRLDCLGLTAHKEPRHPLRLAYAVQVLAICRECYGIGFFLETPSAPEPCPNCGQTGAMRLE